LTFLPIPLPRAARGFQWVLHRIDLLGGDRSPYRNPEGSIPATRRDPLTLRPGLTVMSAGGGRFPPRSTVYRLFEMIVTIGKEVFR